MKLTILSEKCKDTHTVFFYYKLFKIKYWLQVSDFELSVFITYTTLQIIEAIHIILIINSVPHVSDICKAAGPGCRQVQCDHLQAVHD